MESKPEEKPIEKVEAKEEAKKPSKEEVIALFEKGLTPMQAYQQTNKAYHLSTYYNWYKQWKSEKSSKGLPIEKPKIQIIEKAKEEEKPKEKMEEIAKPTEKLELGKEFYKSLFDAINPMLPEKLSDEEIEVLSFLWSKITENVNVEVETLTVKYSHLVVVAILITSTIIGSKFFKALTKPKSKPEEKKVEEVK
jgi:hypothetical protein